MKPAQVSQGHPRPDELRRFLLGDLPEPDLDRVALHLEECPLCVKALPEVAPLDSLVAALRQPFQAEPHAGEAELAAAMRLLATKVSSLAPPPLPAAAGTDTGPHDHATPPPAPRPSPPGAPTEVHACRPVPRDPFTAGLPCAFGRYEVLERLGKGGMGAVYLARDTALDRRVALKVCRQQDEEDLRVGERFLREAQAAANLQHEGLCRVLDFGVQDGVPYLTMDYVQGQPLSRLLAGQALEQTRAARLVQRVALALDVAHRQGIIHRDLKPANIMLDDRDRPTVVDFGLARREQDPSITQQGFVIGTPAYMSPEQVNGGPIDPRSDVYSLGVIFYELLTGRRPYRGTTASEIMSQVMQGLLERPSLHRRDLDARLEAVCLQALARAPADRQATMGELAAALDAFLTGTERFAAKPAATPGKPAPSRPGPGRRRWIAAALLAVLGLGAAGYFLFRAPADKERRQPATPFKGSIDVRIWEKGNPERAGLGLRANGALPLKAKDTIRVEATMNRPVYLYILWIEADGKVLPVYPWKPGHWDGRPDREQRVAALSLPADGQGGWEINAGRAGMETLVMLVRETPLPRSVDLPAILGALPAQRMQHPQSAVWFENGAVVEGEADRGPNLFDVKRIDDPVLQTQGLLRNKLGRLCEYTRAVSFANRGK
jgi:serine/threonine protein kinase